MLGLNGRDVVLCKLSFSLLASENRVGKYIHLTYYL